MTVVSHEVHPMFAEPYFRANIAGTITPDQIAFIKGLKMVSNMENLISENLYIFEEPELKSIKDAVQEVLDIYARDVMCISQRLYVTQSWSLINNPNVGMHGHSHSNSILSGSLYYCELPSPPGRMQLLMFLKGSGRIAGEAFEQGEAWMVPAGAGPSLVEPLAPAQFLRTWVP